MSPAAVIRGRRSSWLAACVFGAALCAPGLAAADWGSQTGGDPHVVQSALGTPTGPASGCLTATPCAEAPAQPPPDRRDAARSEYEPATRSDAPADDGGHPYSQSHFQLGAGHQE